MKAKRIFTKSEIEAIKKFLDEKPNASVDKQGNRVLSKSEIAELKKMIDAKPRTTQDGQTKRAKFSIYTVFEFLFEVFGWLKIMASPLLIGVVIGLFIYVPDPNNTRLLIATLVVISGLVVGIILATSVWRSKGTMDFLAEIMASHDFDHFNDKKEIEDTPPLKK